MLYSAGTANLFKALAGGAIHSALWLNVLITLAFSIGLLLYVAQAVAGFGLLKLRNWARLYVIVMFVVLGASSFLVLPFFLRPWSFVIAFIVGWTVPSAWIVWYFNRPRIRFAFEVWSPPSNGSLATGQPPALSRIGKVWVLAAAVASFTLFFCCLIYTTEDMTRSSGAYQAAVKEAQGPPCVASLLGTPISAAWGSGGNFSEGKLTGSAHLDIPVRGPKGKAELVVSAQKQAGVWRVDSLVVVRGTERTQISPPKSTGDCR